MFGQDDTKQDDNNTSVVEPTDAATDDVTTDTDAPVAADSGSTDDEANETPVAVTSDTNDAEETSVADTEATDSSSTEPAAETEVTPTSTGDDELLEVKKEALTDLAPLVSHLDQTPEEHFKTIMMLIQATDNSSYVKEAYDSAKQISDDAVRAQALLDIVNEINYFTQKHNTPTTD